MSIKFAAIGFAHNHIFTIVNELMKAGAEFVSYYEEDEERVGMFTERFDQGKRVDSMEEILEDESIDLVASAAIPRDRTPIGIRVMQHGKDFVAAKPAITILEQLEEARRVQAETGRIFSVYFGERFHNPSTIHAGDLVQQGVIGDVVQTVGFGPHRLLGHVKRPFWQFENDYTGGTICDLASHQMDQFLFFTGSTEAEVVAAHVGNFKFKQYPNMHDYGDVTVRSPHASGYVRVDWLTPKALDTWGDVRLFIQGTEGYIELRKNTDLVGREGSNHLFLVNGDKTEYIDCKNVPFKFGEQFVSDVLNRTETAMGQAHCFLACELALKAEQVAVDLTANRA